MKKRLITLAGCVILTIHSANANFELPDTTTFPPEVGKPYLSGKLIGSKPFMPFIATEGYPKAGEILSINFEDQNQYQFADADTDTDISSTTLQWYCFSETADVLIPRLLNETDLTIDKLEEEGIASPFPAPGTHNGAIYQLAFANDYVESPECTIGYTITPTTETGSPERENKTLIVPDYIYTASINVDGLPTYTQRVFDFAKITIPTHEDAFLAESEKTYFEDFDIKAEFTINEGFPTTGFRYASFILKPSSREDLSGNYNWTSSHPSLAEVSAAGRVTLLEDPEVVTPITITATPKKGGVNPTLTYTFAVREWWEWDYN